MRGCRRWGWFLVCCVAMPAAADEPYAWPLDLSRVLTSSFAEYRPGRYHMGIDLRTGPSPQRVYAASDGYVSRLRCSPHGYGKAVYLHLNDGNSTVYAHLSDFSPELREHVRRVQHDRRQYTVDIYPEAKRFPVKRGDLIGHSGQTGIGVPHLHYEIRDPSGAPVNPKMLGLTWPDAKAPIPRKLLVLPLESNSRAHGHSVPSIVKADPIAKGHFRTVPVEVSGAVAFGLDVADYANGSQNRLGVYRVRVRAGEREIFNIQHDRVSYERGGGGLVAYYPYLRRQGRFLMLWRWPGNRSEIFSGFEGDGVYRPEGQSETITVEISDFLNNTTVLEVPIVAKATPAEPVAPRVAAPKGVGTVAVNTYSPSAALVSVEFSAPEPDMPVLNITGERTEQRPFRRINERHFELRLEASPGIHGTLSVQHPRVAPQSHYFRKLDAKPDRRISEFDGVRVGGGSSFGSLWMVVSEASEPAGQNLVPLGKAVRLEPTAGPLDEPVSFEMQCPSDAPRQTGLYRKTSKGWSWVSSKRTAWGVQADIDELGIYRVFVDETKPRLSVRTPKSNQPVTSRRPAIRVHVDDVGSGVASWNVTANGQWLLAAYDPERKLIEWEQDEDLPNGQVELVLEVRDEAGNVSQQNLTLAVPD